MSVPCEICFEPYLDFPHERLPRILPSCGHDFCSRCISALCREPSPACPKCRSPIFSSKKSVTNINSGCDSGDTVVATATTMMMAETRCPVVRCLVQLEDRLDFSLPGTHLGIFCRALQSAPTEFIKLELDQREAMELVERLPSDLLQQELAKRGNSTATTTTSPSSTRIPTAQQHPWQARLLKPLTVVPSPVAAAAAAAAAGGGTTMSTTNRREVVASLESQSMTPGSSQMLPGPFLPIWPPLPSSSSSPPPRLGDLYDINNNNTSMFHSSSRLLVEYLEMRSGRSRVIPPPNDGHSSDCCTSPSSNPYSPQGGVTYCRHCFANSGYCSHQGGKHYSCGNDAHGCCEYHHRGHGGGLYSSTAGFIVCGWRLFLQVVRHILSGLMWIGKMFEGIQREQVIQLAMIANSIPLLAGSIYFFLNPDIFVRLRS